MERKFDEELNTLKEKLMQMATLAEESISLAVRSLKERNEDHAHQVFQGEETLNLLDVEIDKLGMQLFALRQPMAIDLRLIIVTLRISVELERIGDLAVNIAQRSLELLKQPPLKPLIDIPRMAELAQKMVKDSIDAFVNNNAQLAKGVCERDDEVDDINDQIFRELLTYMMQDPTAIEEAVGLILVGRYLERIADLATNIGEEVIYLVKGKSIKHHCE